MFESLPGSRPLRGGRFSGTALSALTHGALIAFAVTSTRGTSPYPHGDHESVPAQHVSYVTPSLLFHTEAPAAETRPEPRPPRKTAGRIWTLRAPAVQAGAAINIHIPTPDVQLDDALNQQTNGWLSHDDGLVSDTTKGLAKSIGQLVAHPLAGGVYTPEMVDRMVAPKPGNPTPRYPQSLLSAGIEATLDVTFVVDTTGKVEEPTIAFPATAHRLFAEAVRYALLRSRYFPASLGGRVVPQLVQQQFRFVVRP
jgi:TonB family protein